MPKSVRPIRLSHMNLVMEDFDASVNHLRDFYGAEFLLDLPGPNWHACLMEIGGVILELFVPPAFLLHSRHGPHYLGVEYQADIDAAREAVATHGIRIMRDLGVAFHTHPADCFGVDYEFYVGSFHKNDPPHLTQTIKPAEYWRDEHPLGLAGIKGYTHAVSDIEAASRFLRSFLAAKLSYEADRPAIGARAVGLEVSDDTVELLAPTGGGVLRRELEQVGQGIRSTVFRTCDLDRARHYFVKRGVPLIPGTAPDSFAVAPAANLGILFEFSM
jgi:hypothetical protein